MPEEITTLQCLITEELIREEFPEFNDNTWFSTGIIGVMPKSAVKALAETMMRYETELFFKYNEVEAEVEILRERLAFIISAGKANEICFTRNANEGIIIALSSIYFKPGDEIVTSNQEHGAMSERVNYVQRRGRAVIRTFEIFKDPEETLESVKGLINEKTRLMAFSHVSCQTGIHLPVIEICKIAREVGAYILLDGAQSIGNIPVNVQEYNCDFYVGNGHKWICGPRGTSFLYVNPDSTIEPDPTFMAFDFFSGDPLARRDAMRFEYGTRDRMLLYGLKTLLDLYAKWNWQLSEGRIKELSAYLKERLKAVPKCIIHTPVEWDNSSGNTSFSIEGHQWDKVSEYLSKQWRMMTRGVPEINGIRISTNYFNTHKEIDKLIKALKTLSS